MPHTFAIEVYREASGFGRWETYGCYQTDNIDDAEHHVAMLNNSIAWKVDKRCQCVRLSLKSAPEDEGYEMEMPAVL